MVADNSAKNLGSIQKDLSSRKFKYSNDEEGRGQFIEDMALMFENIGMTRTPGRIIAALMIGSPPWMSLNELKDLLQMSKSHVSTALNMLEQIGFVQRFPIVGMRPDYYKINTKLFEEGTQKKLETIVAFRTLLENSINFMIADKMTGQSDDSEMTRQHWGTIVEMHEMYVFFESRIPEIYKEWEEIRKKKFGH